MRSGILAREGRDVPLSRVNDVSFQHTLLERILRCGTLIVESAGERGQVTLTDVPRVERVQRTVYDLVDKAGDGRS
jgi:membrane protein YdbS with pleckstrin-like domain